jgi:DNA polymerase epsilon subunit 1
MWNATEKAAALVAADSSGHTLATYTEKVTERLTKILSADIDDHLQTELITEVQSMIQNKVRLVGSLDAQSSSDSAAAVEYVKTIMHILEVAPSVSSALRMAKNNCLRICGVGPFSDAATLRIDLVASVQLQQTRCSFCNEEVIVDVTKSGADLRCTECTNPFTREALEGQLVRRVNQLVANLVNQDFVCVKCNRVTDTLMTRNCCGELIGKARDAIAAEFGALLKLAVSQQFLWLAEVVEYAISCT